MPGSSASACPGAGGGGGAALRSVVALPSVGSAVTVGSSGSRPATGHSRIGSSQDGSAIGGSVEKLSTKIEPMRGTTDGGAGAGSGFAQNE